jgi:hypothetical protein
MLLAAIGYLAALIVTMATIGQPSSKSDRPDGEPAQTP